MKKLLLLAVLFILVLAGCQKEDSLINPVAEKSGWENAAKAQGLQIISLPAVSENRLDKIVLSCTELARANSTTNLSLDKSYRTVNGGYIHISARLSVPPKALNSDKFLTMSLNDDIYMLLTFGPHPLVFNTPASLDVTVSGLDLSFLSPRDKIKLVYYNDISGQWEFMNAREISFDVRKGEINCKDGEIPHFSRYGFTRVDGTEDPGDGTGDTSTGN